MRKTKGRTLLTNKKEAVRPSSKANVKLEKLPDRPPMGATIRGKSIPPDLGEDNMPQLKTLKLSKSEQVFLKEYRRLEELEREKGIKFF